MSAPVKILIVDDDQTFRMLLREALSAPQYLTEEAVDGVDALKKVSRFRPDLILLDIQMPRMDGVKVCEYLKQKPETRDIPVIMLSAYGTQENSLRCLEGGPNDFIRKPFETSDLLARITRQLKIRKKLERLVREREDLRLIQEILHTLYEKDSMYELLYTLVRKISEIIQVERCSFVRIREDGKTGVVEASSDDRKIRNLEIDLGKYPEILEVQKNREILILQDILSSPLMTPVRDRLKNLNFRSLVLVPVTSEGRIAGTFLLRMARGGAPFSEREISFLKTIAEAARPVIQNAQRFEEVENRLLTAPVKDPSPLDSPIQFNLPPEDQSGKMLDEVFRLQGGIRYLKKLREKTRNQKPLPPPGKKQS